ncbi:MAG: LysR substrate-binding domain-containing protein [Pseudomonadota bacterium]
MFFTQLRSFHAVAEEEGFTAAARSLNVSQPTITVQVKALEEFYRVELFHRRGRKVILTEAGQALLNITRRLMSLEAEASDLLNEMGGFHSGQLNVMAVGPFHVMEMLASFNALYPGIKVSVGIGNSRDALNALFAFRADVAVLAQVQDDPRLFARPFRRHPVIIFVNKRHRLARRKSISIQELAGERFVMRESGSTTRLAFEQALLEADVPVNRVMEIGSREAVWMAVQLGMGIGVVSEIEFTPHPLLQPITISDAKVFTYAHVVCLAERADSRIVKAFIQVVDQILKKN